MDIKKFTNNNPTEAEKKMYFHCGLYLIRSDNKVISYAPIMGFIKQNKKEFAKANNEFPLCLEDVVIDYKQSVNFDLLTRSVFFGSECCVFDMDSIMIIANRMYELGWT